MLTAEDLLLLTSQNPTPLVVAEEYPPLFFKDLRIFLKLTQAQMAKKLGVSPTTINNYETGRAQPSPLNRHRMEKQLKIPPSMIYRMFPPRPPKRFAAAGAAA